MDARRPRADPAISTRVFRRGRCGQTAFVAWKTFRRRPTPVTLDAAGVRRSPPPKEGARHCAFLAFFSTAPIVTPEMRAFFCGGGL